MKMDFEKYLENKKRNNILKLQDKIEKEFSYKEIENSKELTFRINYLLKLALLTGKVYKTNYGEYAIVEATDELGGAFIKLIDIRIMEDGAKRFNRDELEALFEEFNINEELVNIKSEYDIRVR